MHLRRTVSQQYESGILAWRSVKAKSRIAGRDHGYLNRVRRVSSAPGDRLSFDHILQVVASSYRTHRKQCRLVLSQLYRSRMKL